MIEQYENYLEELLIKAGITSKICKSIRELTEYSGSHVGGIVLDKEKFEVEKKNKIYVQDGLQKKRVNKLSRNTEFLIVIGEHTTIACDKIFSTFLSVIDKGIYDETGNYVGIEVGDADWLRDKDSLLRSSVVVQVGITFNGGIYKDYEFQNITLKGGDEDVKKS